MMMMIDYRTYYQGIVEANGHCKLSILSLGTCASLS